MRVSQVLSNVILVLSLAACAESERQPDTAVAAESEQIARVALQEWDQARARAWASADIAALRSLYVEESAAGAQDAAMLRTWRKRGLRVTGMQTQVLAVRIVEQAPDRLVMVVTDRLARAVATGRGQRSLLPADGATTRRVTLRWAGGVWRMASVMPWPEAGQLGSGESDPG